MKTRKSWRIMSSLMIILSLLVPLATLPASVAAPASRLPEEKPVAQVNAAGQVENLFEEGFVNVRVVAPAEADLSKYGQFVKRLIPDITPGMVVYYGRVAEDMLSALQANRYVADVARIQLLAEAPDARPDPEVTTREMPSMEETRARLMALRDNPPEPTQRPEPTGWWDVTAGGHNAQEAWDNGFYGGGVAVAVNDSGVDMAHPDYWGTEHRYTNVSGDPYYDYFQDWPVALDPFANYLMAFDLELNGRLTDLNTFNYGASHFADTSATGTGATIVFDANTYTTSGTASPMNPVYHIGYHPDWSLEWYVWGDRIGVLVVDEDGDDVYDTVYVDLNNNRDFRDDKPVRKDTNWGDNYVQGAEELSWWDADLDGYPDVSGGMLYFIADGERCPPFFDVYFGCSTSPHGGSYPPPGNGDLIAFMFVNLYDTDHGQLCASNVVGQGNINGPAPDGSYPDWKPDGMGGMVQGAGVDAKVVPVGDVYFGFEQTVEQAWWFQALGYDGWVSDPSVPGGDDALQASSNSFGPWAVYEDGWDEWSRLPTYLNYEVNPYTSFFMSSGNTGGGYGTTGAPQPITAIQVGSSSEYGSSGVFEPLASLDQITAGELASYSSRGPSANNQLVPHVTANGAWGSGAIGLNEVGDGWIAWDLWGGTSRSGPVAMGAATLVMDAYAQDNGSWPDWYEVQQFMMQGANHIYNSPMDGGTGYVNAGRSAAIAGGLYGVVADPNYWDVGDFEGTRYPGGFAHITEPGDVFTTDLDIANLDATDSVTVTVSDYVLEEIAVYTHNFTTLDYTLEDGEFLKPDYLFNVEEIVGGPLPADTVFVLAELMHPFDTFDFGADDTTDSYFRLNGYDWTDLNGDGNLWEDLNGDGLVQWDEIDELEYVRINRAYDEAHYQILPISDPLNRFNDGVFLSIRHRQMSADVPTTPITLRVIAYRQAEWDALDTSVLSGLGSYSMSGGEVLTATVVFTAPLDYGFYQGAIQIDVEPEGEELYTTIVPVFAQVAYSGDLTAEPTAIRFGDVGDADQLYSNGYVRPIQDWWQGRATGGDWRFFFLDQETNPNDPGRQTQLVARTWWDADAPPADIDTYLLGPDFHFSSISNDPNPPFGSSYAVPGGFWGPYSLRITGQSESPLISGGHWAFDTATGANVDYTLGDFNQGLNGFQIHSVRYDGETFREDYHVDVGYVDAPEFLEWDNYATERITLTTNLTFTENISVTAFGLSPVDIADLDDEFVPGPSTGAFNACVATYFYTFTVTTNLNQLHVFMDDFGGDDLDLFLLYDYSGDGVMQCASEVIANSGNSAGAPEEISLSNPPQGTYWVAVDPYTVGDPAGTTFDLLIDGMEMGDTIQVTNLDVGSFGPGDPIAFDVLNKAGTCSDATQECLGGFAQVWLESATLVALFDIPVSPRYSQMDLSQLSHKEVSDGDALPGDVLTYTIHVINTSTAAGTVVVTDVLPSEVTFLDATSGYSYDPVDHEVSWSSVAVAAGGGKIVTADYDWVDISGELPYTGPWMYAWRAYDDEGIFTVTLPFTYTFFGIDYTEAYVSANGQLQFDLNTWPTAFADGLLPGDDWLMDWYWGVTNDNRIAALFGDQTGPDGLFNYWGVGVYPQWPRIFTYHDDNGTPSDLNDDRFVTQWDEWSVSPNACYALTEIGCDVPHPDNTYQLILYADGRAKVQYAEINEIPPSEMAYYGGGVWDYWNTGPQAGVEGPADWYGTHTGEGYAWHLTPDSGLAWTYVPASTSETVLTVTAQITSTLDDTSLCNEAYLDNGYSQVTYLEACTDVGQAELEVLKLVDPDKVVAGDTVTFTVAITNSGPLATTVVYTDTLDEGFDPRLITGTQWIDDGEVFTVSYTAQVTSTAYNDELCNDLVVDNGFGVLYGDSACVKADVIDLSSSDKTVAWDDPYPWPGTVLTYTVEVVNDGNITTTAWITDVWPGEVAFGGIVEPASSGYVTATHVITAYFDEIGPGVTKYLVFTATIKDGVPRGTTVVNEAEIEDAAGDVWSVDVDFDVENADFSNSWKDGSGSAIPGDVFTYTIHVVNSGGFTATATMTDVIPSEVEVDTGALAPDIGYDPVTRVITWTGAVSASASVTLTVPVEVQRVADGSVAVNEATISTDSVEDGVWVTDPVYTVIDSAVLYLEKGIYDPWGGWGYEMNAPWGEVVTYTLYVENVGVISTTGSLVDPLPDGVVVITDSLPAGVTYDPVLHTISWTGVITDGWDFTLEIPVRGTLAAALADKALFNQFTVTDEWGQVYESNMSGLHLESAEIDVVKLANSPTVKTDGVITYTVLLRNVGDAGSGWWSGWEATMVDNLPSEVSYVPGSIEVLDWPDGWPEPHCTPVGNNIVCEFNVDPWWTSNEVQFRYAVQVNPGVAMGTLLTNTVSVNDSYGVMTYGSNVVEVVARHFVYLPMVVRDYASVGGSASGAGWEERLPVE